MLLNRLTVTFGWVAEVGVESVLGIKFMHGSHKNITLFFGDE
jgi:hypothetical protein